MTTGEKSSIIIGSDHAGFTLKEHVKKTLLSMGFNVKDIGATSSETSDDYPVYISQVAVAVSSGEFQAGVAIDGMGIGASIVANRYSGIRAAICMNTEMSRIARAHNDANVMILGGWITTPWFADEMIKTWFKTKFEGGRHARRIGLIDDETRLRVALNHLSSIETAQLPSDRIDELFLHVASKGIERLRQLFRADERRMTAEARLTNACPTTVHFKETKFSALMIDLSDTGAKFKMGTGTKKFLLSPGDFVELEVKTPYGLSKCSADVVWIDKSFYISFGVRFTKLSDDKKDPLRALMDTM